MNTKIEFKAEVEDVHVQKEKANNEVVPVTYMKLKIIGHEPRAGSFICKDAVSVTLEG